MKKYILLLSVCSLLWLLPSCGNSETSSDKVAEEHNEAKLTEKMENDAEFAVNAAGGGLMEVELGNYAAANASSPRVKDFGRSMAADHSKANDELKSAAAAKNITLPAAPPDDKQKMINDLKEKKGAEFDKAYIDMMVSDHKEDLDLFKKQADNGKDADLKAWAAGKVPVLEHHLQMAEELQKELNNQK
ncbi:MAG: outer membrane protein-like protein [Flavipsychrobacter sp.]|nr:outer membrane protein-like protein [Flavipsychrobacter sp.]